MDGSLRGTFVNGEHFRPASLEHALRYFPEVCVNLALNKYTICHTSSSIGNDIVILRMLNCPKESHAFLQEDFELCNDIAILLGKIPVFLTESKHEMVDRAKSHVRVKFSGRSDF